LRLLLLPASTASCYEKEKDNAETQNNSREFSHGIIYLHDDILAQTLDVFNERLELLLP
jgi:hypothetical protein